MNTRRGLRRFLYALSIQLIKLQGRIDDYLDGWDHFLLSLDSYFAFMFSDSLASNQFWFSLNRCWLEDNYDP